MNFKCKCGSTKYRQISTMVKQCLECGLTINDEGLVDTENLDFSEEPDPLLEKKKEELDAILKELKTTWLYTKIHSSNGIFDQLAYSPIADSGIYNGTITGTSTGTLTSNNAYLTFDSAF